MSKQSYITLLHGSTHAPNALDDALVMGGTALSSGIENIYRQLAGSTSASSSGQIWYSLFYSPTAFAATKILTACTAAATGLTLARCGLYLATGTTFNLVAKSADLHAAGANVHGGSTNVALWGSANNIYEAPLTLDGSGSTIANYAVTRGAYYAVAFIGVGTTPPTLAYNAAATSITVSNQNLLPMICGAQGGQADLPTSVTFATLHGSGARNYWVAVTP